MTSINHYDYFCRNFLIIFLFVLLDLNIKFREVNWYKKKDGYLAGVLNFYFNIFKDKL